MDTMQKACPKDITIPNNITTRNTIYSGLSLTSVNLNNAVTIESNDLRIIS